MYTTILHKPNGTRETFSDTSAKRQLQRVFALVDLYSCDYDAAPHDTYHVWANDAERLTVNLSHNGD